MISIKRVILTAAFVAATTAAGTIALAADSSKAAGSGPSPYTDCGIGAALFPDTHWAAVTSNVIWDLGVTALTSATSSPQTCQGKKVQAAIFIGTTYEELVEETAVGHGEHLATALNLFDCKSSQHARAIGEVRSAMGQAVAAPNYMSQTKLQKAATYYSAVERAASHSCTA